MKDLTQEQIERIYALYIGADLQCSNKAIKLTFQNINWSTVEHLNCKLILKELSSISDEDAVEFAKLNRYTTGKDAAAFVRVAKDIIERVSHPDNYPHTPMCYPYDAYMFLIQKHYAVPLFIEPNHPFNGKTAIQLNLAVSDSCTETTTSTTSVEQEWLKYYKPPFWYDSESGGYVFDNEGNMIIEVRGWGRLCNFMSEGEAWKIQDKLGEHLALLLNSEQV